MDGESKTSSTFPSVRLSHRNVLDRTTVFVLRVGLGRPYRRALENGSSMVGHRRVIARTNRRTHWNRINPESEENDNSNQLITLHCFVWCLPLPRLFDDASLSKPYMWTLRYLALSLAVVFRLNSVNGYASWMQVFF